jgi:hypothetical protein
LLLYSSYESSFAYCVLRLFRMLINVRIVCLQLNESRLDILRRVDLSFPTRQSLVFLRRSGQSDKAYLGDPKRQFK